MENNEELITLYRHFKWFYITRNRKRLIIIPHLLQIFSYSDLVFDGSMLGYDTINVYVGLPFQENIKYPSHKSHIPEHVLTMGFVRHEGGC